MKYLEEFRDEHQVKKLLDEIHSLITKEWQIMEICGGQTHSLVKNGILNLLPDKITMVHGPGCPVCVTPIGMIDKAVELALKEGVILCSFGDMVRVPGSEMSLLTMCGFASPIAAQASLRIRRFALHASRNYSYVFRSRASLANTNPVPSTGRTNAAT